MASGEGSTAIPMDQPHSDKSPQIELPFARDFEYQAGRLSAGVEGRLFRARAFWLSKLSCPLFVKNIVTYGYALPLKRFPASAFLNNNQSALAHSSFVEEAIAKLLTNRCIKECDVAPRVVNPLSVAEGKKLRLVLDLRHVNQYVEATRFKYEDLKTLAELFEAGSISSLSILKAVFTTLASLSTTSSFSASAGCFLTVSVGFTTLEFCLSACRRRVTFSRSLCAL